MASTDFGVQLTEAHRRQQLAVRSAALRDFSEIWPLWTPGDDASWRSFEVAARGVILDHGTTSARLSTAYYQSFRTAEVGGTITPAITRPTVDLAELRRSGPAYAKHLASVGVDDIAGKAFVSVAGEVTKQTLDGGRGALLGAVDSDPVAIGWARVTDGNPCPFCAMLAGRGPVYKTRGTATTSATGRSYHKHCGCTAEPVYRPAQPLPPESARFRTMWNDAMASAKADGSLSNGTKNPALNAFRRALTAG